MIRVAIIGSGNVAQHLAKAIDENAEAQLVQVFARNASAWGDSEIPIITEPALFEQADLYIIAVSDQAITQVSEQLPFSDRLVVHTSGSMSLNAIDPKNRRGVLYPLQTFTKGRSIDFADVPLCIEADSDNDLALISELAKALSANVVEINSSRRAPLHAAAVFVNNFVNHLYKTGSDICKQNDISFDILKPLISETAAKVMHLSPEDAQTGPAKRHDEATIEKHLSLLESHPRQLYRILTKSIQAS